MSWNRRPGSKYNARKCKCFGSLHEHDSVKESRCCLDLRAQEQNGEISELRFQVEYELQPSFKFRNTTHRAIKYVADFVYEEKTGTTVVEDCKGMRTQAYMIKKKLLLWQMLNSGIDTRFVET